MLERTLWRIPKNDIRRHVHILQAHDIIYVSVPKVACSTLKATFQRLEKDDPIYVPDKIHNKRLSPLASPLLTGFAQFVQNINDPQFKRICFVRNPYSRALSGYLSKIRRPRRKNGRIKGAFINLSNKTGLDPEKQISFSEFLEAVDSQDPFDMDVHWRPQTEQLLIGDIQYDFIGRLENFDLDLKTLSEMIGTNLEKYLLVSKHKTGAAAHLNEVYSDYEKKMVLKIYDEDFDNFDYSRELPE